MANIYQETHSDRHANSPLHVPFAHDLQNWIVFPAYEHVPIHVHQDEEDVCAHFY
jgi:hypothetical protein